MFSFRGDAHKLYVTLREQKGPNKKLEETADIKGFYETLDSDTLQLVHYRMIKEKNGVGIILIYVTSIPWLLFLFSNKMQDVLFKNGIMLGSIFILIYLVLLTISVIFHFKEKAWSAFHTEIINDILKERDNT
ncbi:hypothetical protein ACFQ3N_15035 [Virgibacillus byunsanensis]|uniref:DUF485 domain-containing protein n=1 Tax=Virgibacillus byunsanensis TaxID=570945 RepID=A0ABW3LQS3_9BACI